MFSNPVFVTCCAVGFIVRLAMFGSVTYMPVYLQIGKGVSPTMAGFVLTPMILTRRFTPLQLQSKHFVRRYIAD